MGCGWIWLFFWGLGGASPPYFILKTLLNYRFIMFIKWLCRPSLVDTFNNPTQLGFGLAKGLVSTNVNKYILNETSF